MASNRSRIATLRPKFCISPPSGDGSYGGTGKDESRVEGRRGKPRMGVWQARAGPTSLRDGVARGAEK